MSDDFGTVNVRRGDRARELEMMRQRYRAHREALQRMVADAPTDHLATEYQRLIGDLDASLAKLDELEGPGGPASPQPTSSSSSSFRSTMSAGERPLAGPPADLRPDPGVIGSAPPPNPASRVAIIIIGGVIVLVAIVYLIWRGSERKGTPVVESPSVAQTAETAAPSTAPAVAPVTTQTTAPATSSLKITPVIADYGVIRKGTRAVRQFEVLNNGATLITIQVARSACRCLFYDYHDKVAPHKKETITVTVDGAKAKDGPLRETLAVTAKGNASLHGELTVQAEIK